MKHLLLACLLTLFSFSLLAADAPQKAEQQKVLQKEAEIGKDLNRPAVYFYNFKKLEPLEEYHCIVDLGSFNYEMEAEPYTKNGVHVGYKCIDYRYNMFTTESYMVDIAFKPHPSDRSVPVTSFYIKYDEL